MATSDSMEVEALLHSDVLDSRHFSKQERLKRWIKKEIKILKQIDLLMLIKAMFSKDRMGSLVLIFAIVVLGTIQNVLFKKLLDALPNYPAAIAILICVLSVPLFFSVTAWRIWKTKEITSEMLHFPQVKFFYMSLLDCLSSVLMVVGGSKVPLHLQTLLQQGVIPVCLGLSFVLLRRRYKITHYLGSFTILIGILVSLLPWILQKNQNNPHSSFWFAILFSSSVLPGALSSIYKESALKDHAMDPFFLNFCVAGYQLFSTVATLPAVINFQGLSIADLGPNLRDALTCFAGQNVHPEDDCEHFNAGALLLGFMAVNFAFNIVLTYTFQHGSAALFFNSSTLAIPCSNLLATSTVIMGASAVTLVKTDIIGLVVLMFGLFLYFSLPEHEESDPNPVEIGEHSDSFVLKTSRRRIDEDELRP